VEFIGELIFQTKFQLRGLRTVIDVTNKKRIEYTN